jgi:hypothetical protein
MQRLVDAGLVGTERAAALQHQRDPLAAVRPPGPRMLTIVHFVGGGIHGASSGPQEPIRQGMTAS